MVFRKRGLIGCGLLFAVSACAPLQQAPLVYSSKITIGIDLSGTTTEQPGVSINLGYKQVDAAYVPVAVAKECEKGPEVKQDCSNNIYSLLKIEGNNKTGSSETPEQAQASARAYLERYTAASSTMMKATEAYSSAASNEKEANEKLTSAQKNGDDTEAILAATDKRNKATEALKEAQEALKKSKESLNEFNKQTIEESMRVVSQANNKSDAYSVFGSFDGNTKAGVETGGSGVTKGEASLVIGKVFSTGVASQFLTEGMKEYYKGIGTRAGLAKASCYSAGEMYISEPKKTFPQDKEENKKGVAAMVQLIFETCGKDPLGAETRLKAGSS